MMRRVLRAVARRWPRGARPLVLMYHRVARTETDPWGLAVSPERFAEQVDFLARRRSVLPLPEFAARLSAGSLPRDAVAITFDDGYVDNLRNAEPILARAGLPATLFVVSGMVGHPGRFWWDELDAMILRRDQPLDAPFRLGDRTWHLQLPARGPSDRPGNAWRAWTRCRTQRQAAFLDLWTALRPLPAPERAAAMDRLRRIAPPAGDPDADRAMRPEELQALASRGTVSIGAHTINHPLLPGLQPQERRREIRDSRSALEALLGGRIAGFCYPYGAVDRPTRDAVAEAGFDWACAISPLDARGGRDVFAIPRLSVVDGGATALARQMARAEWS